MVKNTDYSKIVEDTKGKTQSTSLGQNVTNTATNYLKTGLSGLSSSLGWGSTNNNKVTPTTSNTTTNQTSTGPNTATGLPWLVPDENKPKTTPPSTDINQTVGNAVNTVGKTVSGLPSAVGGAIKSTLGVGQGETIKGGGVSVSGTQTTGTVENPSDGTALSPEAINSMAISDLESKINETKKRAEELKLRGQDYSAEESQIKYYLEVRKAKTRLEEDKASQDRVNAYQDELAQIQSSQTVRRAEKQVANLKQNIAYIGNLGAPGTSSTKIQALEDQVTEANTTLSEIKRTEAIMMALRAEGKMSQARAYEMKLEDLNQALDDNVNQVIINALDKMDTAQINGMVESEADMEGLRQQILNTIDKNIASLTENQSRKLFALADQYKFELSNLQQEAQRLEDYKQKSTQFIQHPGGYWIDGNGNSVLDSNGNRINIQQELPEGVRPIQMGNSVLIPRYDENGKVVYDETKLMEETTFNDQLLAGFIGAIQEGRMGPADIEKINPMLLQNEKIQQAIAQSYGQAGPGVQLTEEQAQNYAKMVANGQIGIKELQSLGIDNQTISNISAYAGGITPSATPMTEYQRAQLEIERAKLNNEEPNLKKIGTNQYGDDIYGYYNKQTKNFEAIDMSGYAGVDMSQNQEIINAHPREASFKNNNPTGLTWGISDNLKGMFDQAGIQYEQGTARPAGEGGNYIKFATVEDGLSAYKISLTQAGGDDIFSRLYRWSAGGDKDTPATEKETNKINYAKSIMSQAGIPEGTKFSQLNEEQLNNLMNIHLKRESPGYFKELEKLEQGGGEMKQEYTPSQKAIMDEYLKNPTNRENLRGLNNAGLSVDDVNNYGLEKQSEASKGLTDRQSVQYNNAMSSFQNNRLVISFENALSSGGDLIASLTSENGPGDVGAVFQFMKTLDPNSVVRESEFAVAQNTAGIPAKIGNLYQKVVNGELLTDEQRKAFGKLAFEYIKNKGKLYDVKYNDLIKKLKAQGIENTELFPTKMSDYIKEIEQGNQNQSTMSSVPDWKQYLPDNLK